MSEILQDIQVDSVLPDVGAATMKQVFAALVKEACARITWPEAGLLDLLLQQEKNASFAIGHGIALPNLQLKFLYEPIKILALLRRPVDFRAADNRPVDIACLILSPQQDALHLRRLARMSRLLKSPELRQRMQETTDPQALKLLLGTSKSWMQAA